MDSAAFLSNVENTAERAWGRQRIRGKGWRSSVVLALGESSPLSIPTVSVRISLRSESRISARSRLVNRFIRFTIHAGVEISYIEEPDPQPSLCRERARFLPSTRRRVSSSVASSTRSVEGKRSPVRNNSGSWATRSSRTSSAAAGKAETTSGSTTRTLRPGQGSAAPGPASRMHKRSMQNRASRFTAFRSRPSGRTSTVFSLRWPQSWPSS